MQAKNNLEQIPNKHEVNGSLSDLGASLLACLDGATLSGGRRPVNRGSLGCWRRWTDIKSGHFTLHDQGSSWLCYRNN